MFSYWEKNFWFSDCDFAVIGSGIVGISTSIELKKRYPNKSVVVIESGIMPTGASTKNAGFACFGTVGEILDDLKTQTREEVKQTITMRWEGLKLLKEVVSLKEMNYRSLGGAEVFADKIAFDHCEANLEDINQLIYESIGVEDVIGSSKQDFSTGIYSHILFNKYEGQLNPVLMMRTLMKKAIGLGVEIINNFKVDTFEDSGEYVNIKLDRNMSMKARQLIVCTNAFSKALLPQVDVVPARNQVLVTKPIDNLKFKGTFHYDRGYVYFRNIGNRLLIGGARNLDEKIEQTLDFGENHHIINHLKAFVGEKLVMDGELTAQIVKNKEK